MFLKKIPLYLKIIIALFLGVFAGLAAINFNQNIFIINYISPFGEIFMRLLKLIAVPLIIASLIKGISDLTDVSQLSKMGIKTLAFYLISTVIAISIGLAAVNIIKPGDEFPSTVNQDLSTKFESNVTEKQNIAKTEQEKSPLNFLVEMVPDNIIKSSSNNRNMLQVIFFAILFGIAIILLPKNQTKTVKSFFNDLNNIILKIIDMIMKFAPVGVFALMADVIVKVAGDNPSNTTDLFISLGYYTLTVILGLFTMIFIVYPILIKIFGGKKFKDFYKGIFPAQILAFSTSSSAATLPLTMECCENNLKIPKSVTGFVLPIGATVNMDGTSLYQAVAAVFIAQVYGIDLSLSAQLTIILTATLASIGSAAVPGAGIIMLIIVLEAVGVPSAGIALIFAVDRPLDMLRTAVNVTGDSTVAGIISKTVSQKT